MAPRSSSGMSNQDTNHEFVGALERRQPPRALGKISLIRWS